MSKSAELVGKRFGKLTVISRTEERRDRYWLWRCRCDCGEEILASTKQLGRCTHTSCGCDRKNACGADRDPEDLTGRRFGRLTVLRLDKRRGSGKLSWFCQCDCGNQCVVTSQSLLQDKRKSCGCLHRGSSSGPKEDLYQMRFGRLTVIGPVRDQDHDTVLWRCRCDCGTELNVSQESLLQGLYKSCGCIRQERQETLYENLTFIDHTCVEVIERRKSRSDNTSGFRGVSRSAGGKWRVSLGFQGKRYYIGLYDDYTEAVDARLRIERGIHDGFLEAYRKWKTKAGSDPGWGERNPFFFRVDKNGREFRIESFLGVSTVAV